MTAGITPAAPLVGAVTTRPPAAFSSLTASAKRLTQSSKVKRVLEALVAGLRPAAPGASHAGYAHGV